MVAVPDAIAETIPVAAPIVATDGVLLAQAPPVAASDRVTALPWQDEVAPVIAGGGASTVSFAVAIQPAGVVKLIIAAPEVTPDTCPLVEFTVATDVLLLVQVPPAVGSESEMLLPVHTAAGPVITPNGFIVMTAEV